MLKTHVGDVEFDSPLLLGSGYITETPKFFMRARRNGCAGMVTRSLKERVPEERQRVPAPRYAVPSPQLMLNCEWGNEHPWESWRDGWLQEARSTGGKAIVSLSGRDIEGCGHLIQAFNPLNPSAYEINVSCSHSGALHGNLNVDFVHLKTLLGHVRPLTRLPIWIKLSYSSFLYDMAIEAQRLGADAIVCTNSIGPGLLLDPETGLPRLGIQGGQGGVTGNAIFPIALRCVYELARILRIPVVGVGGIETAEDTIQMLMAGASAVQLYTAPALSGPQVFRTITRGLEGYLARHHEYTQISDLVGRSQSFAQQHRFEAPTPVVIAERCTGCAKCYQACAFEAIRFVSRGRGESPLAVITDQCNGCNACVGVCPSEFNAIQEVSYGKT
ncbi:4Fe-4S dicluster domain-containing protein [Candidatus Uhrbacteria bacterium]|nr:4Fe-4S dicluster domain-containing protein [Candidatus Uhrbacteria bacterium]